jgi:hypothetical protein
LHQGGLSSQHRQDCCFFPIKQTIALIPSATSSGSATHDMLQFLVGIHTNSLSFKNIINCLSSMHARVANALLVLDGTSRGNQDGIHCASFFKHKLRALIKY